MRDEVSVQLLCSWKMNCEIIMNKRNWTRCKLELTSLFPLSSLSLSFSILPFIIYTLLSYCPPVVHRLRPPASSLITCLISSWVTMKKASQVYSFGWVPKHMDIDDWCRNRLQDWNVRHRIWVKQTNLKCGLRFSCESSYVSVICIKKTIKHSGLNHQCRICCYISCGFFAPRTGNIIIFGLRIKQDIWGGVIRLHFWKFRLSTFSGILYTNN